MSLLGVLLLAATANPGPAQINDTRAAAYASWSLGTTGSPALPPDWPASHNYWGVETDGGQVYVNRFPGVAYWATPAYALAAVVTDEPLPSHPFLIDLRPAAWTAAVTVVLAGLVAFALLRRTLPWPTAGAAAVVLVLGTGLWPLAADALWPHGPAALLLLVVLWGWQRAGPGGAAVAGAAAAGAVLVRPHLVVALAVVGVGALWREPAPRGAGAAVLAGGGAGLLALSAYTWLLFGRFTPTAGYDAPAHLVGLVDRGPLRTLTDLGQALAGTPRGVLLFTPVAAVALVAVALERRALPTWTVVSAAAGLLYLVVQVRAAGPLGGRDFFGPRTSLETLVLAAPLLAVAAHRWAARSRVGIVAIAVGAAVSVGVNGYGALFRSITPEQVARWEAIDGTVRRDFGHLELGEVDLRDRSS